MNRVAVLYVLLVALACVAWAGEPVYTTDSSRPSASSSGAGFLVPSAVAAVVAAVAAALSP